MAVNRSNVGLLFVVLVVLLPAVAVLGLVVTRVPALIVVLLLCLALLCYLVARHLHWLMLQEVNEGKPRGQRLDEMGSGIGLLFYQIANLEMLRLHRAEYPGSRRRTTFWALQALSLALGALAVATAQLLY